jgi:hypothetical protein
MWWMEPRRGQAISNDLRDHREPPTCYVGQSKRVSQYTCWYSLRVIDCVSDYWAKHPPMLPVARTRARAARPCKGESESGYTAMSKSTVKPATRCMF